MQLDPLPEEIKVIILMKGLCNEVSRTEIFQVHRSTGEEALDIALNAELNFKETFYSTSTLHGVKYGAPSGLREKNEHISLVIFLHA